MSHNRTTRTRVILPAILALLCCCSAVLAQPDSGAVQKIPARVVVVEFFWYGCPHCYAFEPYLRQWLETKPDYVEFHLIPGVLNKKWIPHAKAYFVAQKLGVVDKIHDRLFDAIHKQKRKIMDEESLRSFFMEQGIDGEEFSRIYNSPETGRLVQQAYETAMNYQVSSIPTVLFPQS